jgi:hypothetical protein
VSIDGANKVSVAVVFVGGADEESMCAIICFNVFGENLAGVRMYSNDSEFGHLTIFCVY